MSSSVKRRKVSGDEPVKVSKKSKNTAPVVVEKSVSASPEPEKNSDAEDDIQAEDDVEITKTFKDLV